MPDDNRTITAQVSQEFYDQFQAFCFENELSKSDAIREALSMLMEAQAFLQKKDRRNNAGDK